MATGSQTLFLLCDLAPHLAHKTSALLLNALSRDSSVTAHTLSFLFVMICTSFSSAYIPTLIYILAHCRRSINSEWSTQDPEFSSLHSSRLQESKPPSGSLTCTVSPAEVQPKV
jgi:hypothetical protein